MVASILAVLLLAAPFAAGAETIRGAYHYAKRLQGLARKDYAAKKAAEFDGKVRGKDLLYLGFLHSYAGNLAKAEDAFHSCVLEAGGRAKNRPVAMVERVRALLALKRYDEVAAAAEPFLREFDGHRHAGAMHFLVGRARRVLGLFDKALRSFQAAAARQYVAAPNEAADCLLQLGRYEEAARTAKGSLAACLKKALPHLGKPLPKLPLDHWIGGDLAMAELRDQPVVFSFWSTKAVRSNEIIHAAANGWATRYPGKVRVIGPSVYLKFDPHRMKTIEDMTAAEEQGFLRAWHKEYGLKYPLVLLKDNTLHDLCGMDAKRPVLPAFAVSDGKGRLVYLRIGGSPWALEAVTAALNRVTASAPR